MTNRVDWHAAVEAYIHVEAQPGDKYGHQPRLYALATKIAQGLDCDDDVLFASAWMHDLGVFLGHRPSDPEELSRWDHVPYTVAKSRELLTGWGFPVEKLDAVEQAIRTHQPKDEPRTIEATVLRDADMLEQLGAVGALRAMVKVGRDTRFPTFSSVVPLLRKLMAELPGKLQTEQARKLSVPRIAAMNSLLAALEQEAGDRLF